MANWVVSCHGYASKRRTKGIRITTRQKYENCKIPREVELVTYTKQGECLSMTLGWELWQLLVENGDEDAAYGKRHKAKTNMSMINYGLSGPHTAAEYNEWLSWAVPPVCSCGLFEVGDQVALMSFPIATEVCTLRDVLNAAKSNNVARVYFLACQELSEHGSRKLVF